MTNYTLADLQAMANDDLNALAAELRGIRQIGTNPVRWADEQGEAVALIWRPTTDRNQSGALLECATTQGAGFIIDRFGGSSRIACYQGKDCAWICAISGNDARAETIAFCAAMLAMAGRLAND